MKVAFLFVSFIACLYLQSSCQTIVALTNDAQNIFYAGVSNPVTIAAENISSKLLIVKTDNGIISGGNGKYTYYSKMPGRATVFVYRKEGNHVRLLDSLSFRVKTIPLPIFKIGPATDTMNKAVFAAQEYVRANVEGGWEITDMVKSFTVYIFPTDTCKYFTAVNYGSKINDTIKNQFQLLRAGDIVLFKNIIVVGPLQKEEAIAPRFYFIKE